MNRLLYLAAVIFLLPACEDTKTIIQQVEVTPPEPVATAITLDISHSQVSGNLTLNNQPFVGNAYSYGNILFEDVLSGNSFVVGTTQSDEYSAEVINGTYNIYYEYITGIDIPSNQKALIQSNVEITADTILDLNITAFNVEATFSLNGSSFPSVASQSAKFFLQPVETNELVELGQSHLSGNSILVAPGDYHVIYQHQEGDQIPKNTRARVMQSVTVNSNTSLRVDVTTDNARFLFQHNGQPWPTSIYQSGDIYLVQPEIGDEVLIANTRENSTTASVISGTYKAIYRYFNGTDVPRNSEVVILENIDLSQPEYLLNIISSSVDLSLTLNGNAFTSSNLDRGLIEVVDQANDSSSIIGVTSQAIENVLLTHGSYDFVYSLDTGGVMVPLNVGAEILSDVVIDSDQSLSADITAVNVGANYTIDGSSDPTSIYNYALFVLEGEKAIELLPITSTAYSGLSSALVITGTYDIKYQLVNGGVEIPRNERTTIVEAQTFTNDSTVTIDLATSRIDLTVTFNGSSDNTSAYDRGLIYAVSSDDPKDQFIIGATNLVNEDVLILPGTYDLYYELENGGVFVPRNSWTKVGTYTFTEN